MPISKRELWPALGAALMFAASAATLAVTLLARMPLLPVHELREYNLFEGLRDYHFFDLNVYRRAAGVVRDGGSLYTVRLSRGLGFTYPPVAALLFLPLRWLSVSGDRLAVTVTNIALMVVIAAAALRLPRTRQWRGGGGHRARALRGRGAGARGASHNGRHIAAALLAAAVALWVEPISTALGYGQIDLLITALVVVDLVYGRRSRAGGLGIGLAAALKLTPLVFIPYLALTGRGRMATRALAVFALSIAIAFAAVPGDAWTYWFGGKFMDVSRVTGGNHLAGSGAANQSLRGTLLRIFPHAPHLTVIWLLTALIVGCLGLLLAVRAARRGDQAWGFMLTALTGLLISPVSWTHHWTIAAAGVIALIRISGRPVITALRATVAAVFGLGASAIWVIIDLGPGSHPGIAALLLGNLYVLTGLGAIATAAAAEFRHARRRRAPIEGRTIVTPFVPVGHRPTLAPTRFVAATPGYHGDSVRGITTSQALAPDRQSL